MTIDGINRKAKIWAPSGKFDRNLNKNLSIIKYSFSKSIWKQTKMADL